MSQIKEVNILLKRIENNLKKAEKACETFCNCDDSPTLPMVSSANRPDELEKRSGCSRE